MISPGVRVLRPGLLTTVQDLGRYGQQLAGVPPAGPMDELSHRLANHLLGNDAGAATLEITLLGPELEFTVATTITVCGAEFEMSSRAAVTDTPFAVAAGTRLQFVRRRAGARAYLAVCGGFQTPLVLGSRATHLPSTMGGLDGRALRAGDFLPILGDHAPARRRARGLPLPATGRTRLRLLAGPQRDHFDEEALRGLTTTSFRISPQSNRMAYRLEGTAVAPADGALVSEPLTRGALQVPPAGVPLLLMADHQTMGGYPIAGYVIAADLPLAGQLAPGDFVEFGFCSRQDAATALIARERALLRAREDVTQ